LTLTIAILVLNYNGRLLLEECLSSVLASVESRANVYLVDNCSTDGSVEYVRELFPAVRAITFGHNLGFAKAYDDAVKQVNEDLVIFLNNDVKVAKGWFEPLVAPMESGSDERLAVCGSKILFYAERNRVNHAGGTLLPIGGSIDIDFLELDRGEPTRPKFVGCVCGASMAVKRTVFLELGGFDEDFFAYSEDSDFCWRAWLEGYKVMLIPRSLLYHKYGGTSGPYIDPQRVFLGERNRMQCLLKNLETGNAVIGMFLLLPLSILRMIRSQKSRRRRSVLAVAQSYSWVIHNLSLILKKRLLVQRSRVVPDSFLQQHGLMLSYIQSLREFARLSAARRRYPSLFVSDEQGQ
jgi:GT2 family glycosyltransferase